MIRFRGYYAFKAAAIAWARSCVFDCPCNRFVWTLTVSGSRPQDLSSQRNARYGVPSNGFPMGLSRAEISLVQYIQFLSFTSRTELFGKCHKTKHRSIPRGVSKKETRGGSPKMFGNHWYRELEYRPTLI